MLDTFIRLVDCFWIKNLVRKKKKKIKKGKRYNSSRQLGTFTLSFPVFFFFSLIQTPHLKFWASNSSLPAGLLRSLNYAARWRIPSNCSVALAAAVFSVELCALIFCFCSSVFAVFNSWCSCPFWYYSTLDGLTLRWLCSCFLRRSFVPHGQDNKNEERTGGYKIICPLSSENHAAT